MIVGTRPGPDPVVKIRVDVSDFLHKVVEAARKTLLLDLRLETQGKTLEEIDALFYVRGAQDPEFEDAHVFDNYVRVLARLGGERGRVAVAAFMRGWAHAYCQPEGGRS